MRKQKGVVLIVALILLVVTTLIGLASAATSMFNERLASNRRENITAYHSAQYAIENAEAWLQEQNIQNTLPNPIAVPADNASDTAGSIWTWQDLDASQIMQKLDTANDKRLWSAYSTQANPIDFPLDTQSAEQPKVFIQYSNYSGGGSLGMGYKNDQVLDVYLIRAKGVSSGADGNQASRYYESVYVQPHNVQ